MFTISNECLYPKTIEQATKIQRELSSKVISEDKLPKPISCIAGVDVSNNWRDPEQMLYAAVGVLDFSSLKLVESSAVAFKQEFPYIPGFLGFREAPAIIMALEKLKIKPDLLMVDGHGISHPRGLGIASHIGVLTDIPSIGVAKSVLIGKPQQDLGLTKGEQAPLIWHNQIIGMFLRSKLRSNPLIISLGHKVSLNTAIDLVSRCLKNYRLPEPTRMAHILANEYRKSYL